MKIHQGIIAGLVFLSLCACSRQEEIATLKVYHDGHEYLILDRGDTVDQNVPAYFVRYYSQDLSSQHIRKAECADIYAIVAQYINTNEHQRVVIQSVERRGRFFGILKPREISESMPVTEVLKYKHDSKTEN